MKEKAVAKAGSHPKNKNSGKNKGTITTPIATPVMSGDEGNAAHVQSWSEEHISGTSTETEEGGEHSTNIATSVSPALDEVGSGYERAEQSVADITETALCDEVTVVMPPMPKNWLPPTILVFCLFGRVSGSENIEFSQQLSTVPTIRKQLVLEEAALENEEDEGQMLLAPESPATRMDSGSTWVMSLRLMNGAGESSSRRELKRH